MHAHYAGDANYGASDSSPTTVTVNPELSKTEVHLVTLDVTTGPVTNPNATSVPYGSLALLRADVTNSSGATCFDFTSESVLYACPHGSCLLSG